jgi:thiamine-monophosphate kinase
LTTVHGENSRSVGRHEPAKGEHEFLRRLGAELPPPPGAAPFGDDLAPLEPRADGLLWTTDMLMDGVDFDSRDHPWRQIGYKAMAVNLSDCAASATIPVSALCAVALCDNLSMDDALELARGVRECGDRFDCPVTGGDTNSWKYPTVIAITVAARIDGTFRPVTRHGATAGDRVYVSGPVGGSLIGRHLRPQPRIDLALSANRKLNPRAMIDISDGLAIDLWRICELSGCGATLDETALEQVIHADARTRARRTGASPREHALYDGEDFELIIVVPSSTPEEDCRGLGLSPIGVITDDARLTLRNENGAISPLEIRGWEHFRG